MSPLEMYTIVKLDDIRNLLCALSFMAGTTALISGVAYTVMAAEDNPDKSVLRLKLRIRNIAFVSIPLLFLFITTQAMIPSVKQMAAILVVPPIINNDHVQQLPDKLLHLADDWIDKLSPKKVEEKAQ